MPSGVATLRPLPLGAAEPKAPCEPQEAEHTPHMTQRRAVGMVRIPRQLTLYGDEVEHPPKRGHRPLTTAALEVLRVLRQLGQLEPVAAGIAVHRLQGCVKEGARYRNWTGDRSHACCPYAAAAGYRALQQLEARRFAARAPEGHWTATPLPRG
jgi:hypothetical protein